ncbi:hypothetical protein C8J55DRAFT_485050 [Lentinula edodes]|uniref:Uncharacterized protein n=1 Tax=Lentinula lateritia TaxID=40482 RepID=A0A9W9AZK3_9AGAR|nr:hypothetical protein C8J55DRAFT_485050 [Lentinula edodes]
MSDGRKHGRKAGADTDFYTCYINSNATHLEYPKIELPISLQFYYTCPTEKKILKNRIPARTEIWTFDFTQHYLTFKAQLLERSRIFYHPKQILLSDYDISYSIPHIAPNPISINSINSYPPLVESARRNINKAGPLVIYVVSKFSDQTEKENVENAKNIQLKGKKSKLAGSAEEAHAKALTAGSFPKTRLTCISHLCTSTFGLLQFLMGLRLPPSKSLRMIAASQSPMMLTLDNLLFFNLGKLDEKLQRLLRGYTDTNALQFAQIEDLKGDWTPPSNPFEDINKAAFRQMKCLIFKKASSMGFKLEHFEDLEMVCKLVANDKFSIYAEERNSRNLTRVIEPLQTVTASIPRSDSAPVPNQPGELDFAWQQ